MLPHSNVPRSLLRRHLTGKQLSSALHRNRWNRSARSPHPRAGESRSPSGNGSQSLMDFRHCRSRRNITGIRPRPRERSSWWWNRHRYPGMPCPDRTADHRWLHDAYCDALRTPDMQTCLQTGVPCVPLQIPS